MNYTIIDQHVKVHKCSAFKVKCKEKNIIVCLIGRAYYGKQSWKKKCWHTLYDLEEKVPSFLRHIMLSRVLLSKAFPDLIWVMLSEACQILEHWPMESGERIMIKTKPLLSTELNHAIFSILEASTGIIVTWVVLNCIRVQLLLSMNVENNC